MTDPSADLDILIPERIVHLRTGEEVRVREFSFAQELQLLDLIEPIIADLASQGTKWAEVDPGLLMLIIASHQERFFRLMGAACGRNPNWVAGLSGEDGHALALAFWETCGRFFLRRLMLRIAPTLLSETRAESVGEPSSLLSPGTMTLSASRTTPAGS